MHTLWAKICWVSIFLKNRFQIDANDLNLRVAKCIYFQNLLLINNTPFEQTFASIFFKKLIPSTSKGCKCIFYLLLINNQTTCTLWAPKCMFVHSQAHPLSKNWLSQHIFKKQISNWRKWPQFESCQMYIFKMYSSPAIQWRITFNLKCIFVYSHAHPLSKNLLSQHIF